MFEPQNEIERLLQAAAKDPAQRGAFVAAFLDAEICICPTGPVNEQGMVPGLKAVPLGEEAGIAMFTSEARAKEAFGADTLVLANTGRRVLEYLRPGPVVLNPGSGVGVAWRKEDLTAILDGVMESTIQKDTQLMLGTPTQLPVELIERLTAAFENEPLVTEAYLMLAHRGDQTMPSFMLGIGGSIDAVQPTISRALAGYDHGDTPLDLVELETCGFGDTLRGGIPIKAPR